MSKVHKTQIISTVFRGLQDDVLQELRQHVKVQTYPAHTVLCRQGEREHTCYIIMQGRVMVSQKLENGEKRILGLLGSGKIFGEASLIDDTPRMATCTTLSDTRVLEITEDVFDRVVERSPAVAYAILRQVTESLRKLDKQAIEDLKQKNADLEKAYNELKAAQAAIVEKERLERELEIAAEVQRNLLPEKLPSIEGYECAAFLEPARTVGGDFYDVICLNEEHIGILLADVADKSIHAALVMAMTRTLFVGESQNSLSPKEVAESVHAGMFAVSPNSDLFVTAFYGVLHIPTGNLKYIIAGHERPILISQDGTIQAVLGEGRFLGMLPTLSLTEYSYTLKNGERLFVFSDGLPDATNANDEAYDYERMHALLAQHSQLPVNSLIEEVVQAVHDWNADTPAFDDLTLLAIARLQKT